MVLGGAVGGSRVVPRNARVPHPTGGRKQAPVSIILGKSSYALERTSGDASLNERLSLVRAGTASTAVLNTAHSAISNGMS